MVVAVVPLTTFDSLIGRATAKEFGIIRMSSSLTAYTNHPVEFMNDFVKWPVKQGVIPGLAPYQTECLEMLPLKGRVCIRGPHTLGKTSLAALVILWFALTRDAEGDDWKIATTASAWIHLTTYLWPEIRKWARLMDWEKMGRPPLTQGIGSKGELFIRHLRLRFGEAFAASPDDAASIEGAHADRLLYVYDEAKTISDQIFDAVEGAFAGAGRGTGNEALALCISTPGQPVGRFYDIQQRAQGTEDWWVRHVTKDEAIAAGRMGVDWAEQRKLQWGEDSPQYQNRVLGEFASDALNTVIPLSWVEAANLRWLEAEPNGDVIFGCDVAGGELNSDESIIAPKSGDWIGELTSLPGRDPAQVSAELMLRMRANPGSRASVDVIGIGGEVVSRLRENDLPVDAFNASQADPGTDESGELRFMNKRSAGWWNLRTLLDPAKGATLALPKDDKLLGDLTTPTWKLSTTGGGRIQVESKVTIKQRLHRSTDRGDAVMMACYPSQASRMVIGTTADPRNDRGWRRLQGWN